MNDLRKMKLVKSRTNKMLTGVCGGIGELLGIDPTIIRLIWAALSLAGGTGIILYIIAAVIIPEDDDIIDAE
ncbi:PspC domain-containing protein [Coprococcus catus]|uniref:PspC domain-containing protein n=1 Tax=Coprococcus catus TaxID=116085 RepID=UPI0015B7FEA7|nr:PspC domain-containing protein [Coprococcus catus]MBX9231438.1 PspC domain-containing protein [Coprococcus catus]MCT6800613.1 PspC domain-containing protein [Coprococcus catus]MEE0142344.1 PspC domain-containing protein [Coprococcus sp.]